MNALTMSSSRGPLDRAGAALGASTVRRQRFFLTAIYACLMLAAVLLGVFVSDTSDARPTGLGFFALMANFSIWGGWFARVLLLQAASMRLRMPDMTGTTVRALSLAALITIPLPALVLSGLGVEAPVAIGAPLLGALAGILFSVMPWPAACALLALPGLVQMLPFRISDMGAVPIVVASSAVLALMYVGVRMVVRTGDPAGVPTWRRPVMLYAPSGMAAWTQPDGRATPDASREREGWLFAMPRPAHAGPHAPGAAIDTLLAGVMGYVSRRDAVRQWVALLLAAAVIAVVPFRGDTPLIRDALMVGASIGLLAGGWTLAMRLERQRQRPSAEVPELALLPGLGAPPQMISVLLHSAMRRLVHLMLAALAALLFLAWLRASGWAYAALLVGVTVATAAASAWMCTRALGPSRVQSWHTFVAMLPLIVTATWAMLVVMIELPVTPHAILWAVTLIVLILGYLAAARLERRRMRDRSHAFLLD
ncbi:conserved membrane hypothetical protein [Luteimonas sp. 9C]|uniref:hypothetical protein n=1 Tax=Luteimonas sp. 9C TaxID=2653148 RepID=UPI0012F17D8C|nr:hypothetical protein [Luteimonas sp. 9C]VXB20178.1 conserved membrane hypothetical protein [Luteimonas sp. 9C]